MDETYEYPRMAEYGAPAQGRHRRARKAWLALIPTMIAGLVLVGVITAAVTDGRRGPEAPAGALATPGAGPSASPSAAPEPTPDPGAEETGAGGGSGGAAGGGAPSGGGQGSGDGGSGEGGDGDGDPEPPPPADPLNIQATVDTVAPGGQCFASGTITVAGGEYPLTVHYQWRRVALVDGQLGTEPVSPVHNVSFDAPGSRQVQVDGLPGDGPNVRLGVTGPVATDSGWVAYESCQDGPGGLTGS